MTNRLANAPRDASIFLPVESAKDEKRFEVFYELSGRDRDQVEITAVKFGSAVFRYASDAYEFLAELNVIPTDTDADAASEMLHDWAHEEVIYRRNTSRI
jgi:hypothetical protein